MDRIKGVFLGLSHQHLMSITISLVEDFIKAGPKTSSARFQDVVFHLISRYTYLNHLTPNRRLKKSIMEDSSPILIKQFEVGPMENFVYLVGDRDTKEVFVVDPAWEVDTIFRRAQDDDLKIIGALISHHHGDHTNGIEDLLERAEVLVYIHKNDAPFVAVPPSSLTEVDHGQSVNAGKVRIEFLHTPGHTPGSQCFKVSDN